MPLNPAYAVYIYIYIYRTGLVPRIVRFDLDPERVTVERAHGPARVSRYPGDGRDILTTRTASALPFDA